MATDTDYDSRGEGTAIRKAEPLRDGLAASMLQCECFIVAEDDEHMVVGLRVSKAAVLRNHLFLLALSECAANSSAAREA